MKSSIFKLNIRDIAGAIISAVLVAVITYVLKVGDVFALDYRVLVNTTIMTALASLLKSFMTDDDGYFLGGLGVK